MRRKNEEKTERFEEELKKNMFLLARILTNKTVLRILTATSYGGGKTIKELRRGIGIAEGNARAFFITPLKYSFDLSAMRIMGLLHSGEAVSDRGGKIISNHSNVQKAEVIFERDSLQVILELKDDRTLDAKVCNIGNAETIKRFRGGSMRIITEAYSNRMVKAQLLSVPENCAILALLNKKSGLTGREISKELGINYQTLRVTYLPILRSKGYISGGKNQPYKSLAQKARFFYEDGRGFLEINEGKPERVF